MDRKAAARAIDQFLQALGHEPEGPLAQTGELVARAWADELLAGYGMDGAQILKEGSFPLAESAGDDSGGGLVILRDLSVTTICPHHLLPAFGSADVAYLPVERIAGLGSIAQALNARTRRLTLQEQAGDEMAGLLVEALGARGALCRLRLTHSCIVTRGTRQTAALVETVALRGTFAEPGPDRDLALASLAAGPQRSE